MLAVGIIASLFLGGAQPGAVNLIPAPWDKLVHGLVFISLAWSIGVASGLQGLPKQSIAFFGAVLVGGLDEWHQMYLPGRESGWDDFAADVAGSLIGTALLTVGRVTGR